MARWLKMLAPTPDNIGSRPGTHMIDREKGFLQVVFKSLHVHRGTCLSSPHPTPHMMTNTGVDIEKGKHLLLLRVKTGATTIEVSVRFFKRLEIALPYDPAIPPLGMYAPKRLYPIMEMYSQLWSLMLY